MQKTEWRLWVAALLALVALVFVIAGCGDINCAFVLATKKSDDVILPHYLKYVEADESLSEETKENIRIHIETRREVVNSEAALCGGGQ